MFTITPIFDKELETRCKRADLPLIPTRNIPVYVDKFRNGKKALCAVSHEGTLDEALAKAELKAASIPEAKYPIPLVGDFDEVPCAVTHRETNQVSEKPQRRKVRVIGDASGTAPVLVRSAKKAAALLGAVPDDSWMAKALARPKRKK